MEFHSKLHPVLCFQKIGINKNKNEHLQITKESNMVRRRKEGWIDGRKKEGRMEQNERRKERTAGSG